MSNQHSVQRWTPLCLPELPLEVLSLIIELLRTDESAMVPRYPEEREDGLGQLQRKAIEFYGDATDNDFARAKGLRSWSQTCRFFNKLLAPELFNTVLLRSTPKSVESIKALSKTKHWTEVQRFIFVTELISADEESPEEWEGETDEEIERNLMNSTLQRVEAEKLGIAEILSNLPPNLKSLTLDFPQGWDEGYGFTSLVDNHLFGGSVKELKHLEELDRYRALLGTAYEAIVKNDISRKPQFEMRLHNISPFRCSALEKRRLAPFLRHVTSLKFGAGHCDNGAGWNMNTMTATYFFAENLGSYIFDHLDNVKILDFHADESWPFGHPEWHPCKLPLPAAGSRMSKIEHISIKQVFICIELERFLVGHAATLVSINMTDCYAAADDLTDDGLPTDDDFLTWASLFQAVTKAKPQHLINFSVTNSDRIVHQILKEDESHLNDRAIRAKATFKEQNEDIAENVAHPLQVERRKKRLLPYCTLDDKYGMIFEGAQESLLRFDNEIDHTAWLELDDLIEGNIAATSGHAADGSPVAIS